MKTPSESMRYLPRIVMFIAIAVVTVFITHFVLPGNLEQVTSDIVFNPWAQIALFIVLTLGGLIIAFWITFGDLINRGEN